MEHISIPIGETVAWIPYRMTLEDYELLMATLKLWKPNLIVKPDDKKSVELAIAFPTPSTPPSEKK